MRHVPSTRVAPAVATIGLDDQGEHPALGPARITVGTVEGMDQRFVGGSVCAIEVDVTVDMCSTLTVDLGACL